MTRQVWQRDAEGRPTRLVTVETYTETKVRTWVWVALAVLVVALAVMDGGIWW